ncbi:MAG: M50 family metallopeptidase [Holosporales bacterium]|jgi:regulator of sigma E protease|nr:M50 family metallopeptidase [Holosporales bacterium]
MIGEFGALMISKIIETVSSFLPFILVLTVIVFIHEMGHFLIARYNNVHVTTFSIGYGPEIFGWTDKKGTRWCFRWIPLGGYVMMLGDADASSVRSNFEGLDEEALSKTLPSKTPLQRTAVAFGGPLMNIIFTLLIFIFIGLWKGIPDTIPKIKDVAENSIAAKCGLQGGDLITGLNDEKIEVFSEMKNFLEKNAGKDVILHYKRGNEECTTKISLYTQDSSGEKIPAKIIGIHLAGDLIFTKASVWQTISLGIQYCYVIAISMVSGLTKALFGKKDGAKLGGILSIGDFANQSMSSGLVTFLNFMAMLSFSLAIFNLLPIPVLDGGSIVINLLEFIRRKPLSATTINFIYSGGLFIVIGLMIWATWNDLVNYGIVKKIIVFFKKLF